MTGTQEAEVRRDHSKLLEAFIELGNEVVGLREEYRKALEQVDAVRITLASVQRERDEARADVAGAIAGRDAAIRDEVTAEARILEMKARAAKVARVAMEESPSRTERAAMARSILRAIEVIDDPEAKFCEHGWVLNACLHCDFAPNTSHPPSCPGCDSEQCERGGR